MSATDPHGHRPPSSFQVELPGGGRLHLQSMDEVDLWDESSKRYIDDYQLTQQNDLLLLGAILAQQLTMFRAQQALSGTEPELDSKGVPTGRYKKVALKAADMAAAQSTITKAATEIRELEKALGVDKKTRESGGAHTVANYVSTLKAASREFGLHLSKRLTEYERVCMEARWKLRVLRNADPEDRNYHGISADAICEWLYDELLTLEQLDKQFAKTKQRLYLGRI